MECISARAEYISSTIVKQTRTAIEADKNRRNKRKKPNPEPEQPQKPPREPRALLAYGQNDLPGDTTIAFSDTGLATPRILAAWAKKFNVESFEKSDEFKRHGLTFDEWFHPEYGYHSHSKRPASQRSGIRPNYRLLVIDNYYSHWELSFIEYLDQYDIKVMALPPHMTHLMQPLDVSVFSAFKRGHQRTIANQLRYEKLSYGFIDFLDHFNTFHSQTFEKKSLLFSGWRDSGLFPSDPQQILVRLDTMHAETKEPELPNPLQVDDTPWWEQIAIDTTKGLERVGSKYEGLLSSPSRRILGQAKVIANQSFLLSRELDEHEAGKLKVLRTQKSRRQVTTKGGLIDVEELRREEVRRKEKDEADMLKRQQAEVNKHAKAEQKRRRKAFLQEIAAYKKQKGRRQHKMVVLKGLDPCKLQSIVDRETGHELQLSEDNDLPFTITRHRYPRIGTVEENADFVPLEADYITDSDRFSIIIDENPTNQLAPGQPLESTRLASSPPYFFGVTGDGGSDSGNDSITFEVDELPDEWRHEEYR